MIYTFSGTGNSLWAAGKLGGYLGEPVENILGHQDEAEVICSDSVIGFVLPTYMGDIPGIVKDFLNRLRVPSDAYVFLVMTSNNGESGGSWKSMDRALAVSGARMSAFFDLQMPGNCLVSSPEENAQRLDTAPDRVKKIADALLRREMNAPQPEASLTGGRPEVSRFGGKKPKKPVFSARNMKMPSIVTSFAVNDSCTGCGLCADICPTGNIRIADGRAVHGKRCAGCYRCLHWCPSAAVCPKLPLIREGRFQYRHPEITLEELKKTK